MKTLEAIYGVPDETPVVQLFLSDGPQIGEISAVNGALVLELFQLPDRVSVFIPVGELEAVLRLARERLLGGT